MQATINSSYLWRNCTELRLTKNMRLQNVCNEDLGSNDGHASIDLREDILLKSSGDPIKDIISSTYTSYSNNFVDTSYFKERAILAPTLDVV